MDIQEIIAQVKDKVGDKFDVSKITEVVKGGNGKLSISEIIGKLNNPGAIGDLDGDGKVESPIEELKGKAGELFGGIFGK